MIEVEIFLNDLGKYSVRVELYGERSNGDPG
jgi:hypothetical protein